MSDKLYWSDRVIPCEIIKEWKDPGEKTSFTVNTASRFSCVTHAISFLKTLIQSGRVHSVSESRPAKQTTGNRIVKSNTRQFLPLEFLSYCIGYFQHLQTGSAEHYKLWLANNGFAVHWWRNHTHRFGILFIVVLRKFGTGQHHANKFTPKQMIINEQQSEGEYMFS